VRQTVDDLLAIEGRSKMNKAQPERAVNAKKSR
jgi:hypothetical protein